jgi:hypothetical protein
MSSCHIISDALGIRRFLLIDTFSKLSNCRTVDQVHVTPMFHDFKTLEDLFSSAHFKNSQTSNYQTISSRSFGTLVISSHRHFFKTVKLPTAKQLLLVASILQQNCTPHNLPWISSNIEPQNYLGKSNGPPSPE